MVTVSGSSPSAAAAGDAGTISRDRQRTASNVSGVRRSRGRQAPRAPVTRRAYRRGRLDSPNVSQQPSASLSIADVQRRVGAELDRIGSVIDDLGRIFGDAGEEIHLVGGPVRDAMLGRQHNDLDFTTSARPEVTERLLKGWAQSTWDIGREFGTIGGRRRDASGDWQIEITTYRSEEYDADSRKPTVAFGDNLAGDLGRRDFTVNSMAISLPGREFEDPFGGIIDLAHQVIRTPQSPELSFSDDPLRMMRAARFAAQLGFEVAPEVVAAMTAMADRISIISAERVRDELIKLVLAPWPRRGLALLVETGLAALVLPELPALQLERDEHHRHKDVYEHTLTVLEQSIDQEDRLGGPDFVSRFAALMHDVGKPKTRRFVDKGKVTFYNHDVVGAKLTRKRMQALRFSKEQTEQVSKLVELHLRFHGYGDGEWTDSAVRRYVRDAGDQLERLHILTRADCTTRNQRRAERLRRVYDDLEARIERLGEEEELAAIRPDLDGNRIMELLGIGPSPLVGKAYKHLLELRLDEGPMTEEQAEAALRAWAAEQPELGGGR
ncbi:MAG: CCA tRNA nucleotidyltransferase [Myxococcales bacterium]|nr:MAG: CCA tRNA nucleotidyltransferase [Myxococcales bacterium]